MPMGRAMGPAGWGVSAVLAMCLAGAYTDVDPAGPTLRRDGPTLDRDGPAVEHTGGHDRLGHYTPTWAVHVPGGAEDADAVAAEHGFVNLGEIFDNHFHFHHRRVTRRSAAPARLHHRKLSSDSRVRWARQQRLLNRVKRDFIVIPLLPHVENIADRSKRETAAKQKQRPRAVDNKFVLNDPKWPHMWYLNRGGGLDMNVIPAWREGITGRGVVVTILDDGLETDHPDLLTNYDSQASYDVNSHDSDPQPRYDMIDSNRHGTRCAGEVAATANNSLCAVGVAFGARVGGVRMLDGDVTDAVEARSLSLNPQHVDIYSASWGPDDDGKTVDGPGELATRAFIEGVTKGRNGKGSIFVWASGNGGRDQDNCNCDGYTNSIWTLSISSATERGEVPWYSEMCSSTLAATYSSGALNEKQVVTTDLHHSCTSSHTGTSASAPLAAGICALALQANRELTWRDMQHIVVRTARPERLSENGNWRVNGVGRNVSHSFGYGLLDAAAMVRLARSWRTVPPQKRCELAAARPERAVPARGSVVLQLDVQSCPGVNFLEHVQAKVTLSSARRGDLQIFLTSPAGTKVVLLAPRPHDTSRAGFNSWPFMSVHMWGESPIGVWQLEVHNEGRYMGDKLTQWELIFYGTETAPQDDDIGPPPPDPGELGVVTDQLHNHLEEDLGLWEDTQKIRDDTGGRLRQGSRTHGSSSGCLASSSSSDACIECFETLHLFEGRCYEECPAQTYSSVVLTMHARVHDVTSYRPDVTSPRSDVATHTPDVSSQRSDVRSEETPSLEADDRNYLIHLLSPADRSSSLMRREENASDALTSGRPKTPKICLPCHYTCVTCDGPTSRDCKSCSDDAELVNVTSSSTQQYCIPKSLVTHIVASEWSSSKLALYGALGFLCCVGLYYFLRCAAKYGFCEFCCCSRTDVYEKVSYEKVAHDEAQQIKEDIERAARGSDSESEEELDL